ncbi:MAG: methyltransferase domain-containing protein [Ectothiorhodospiraceae bacterium]|jgi:spermidine synthase
MLNYAQRGGDGDRVERPVSEVVAQGRTAYQDYLFFRSPAYGTCVVLDGDVQSCEADEAIYHEALVHPAMLLHPEPRRVLIMGGGEGATAREVLRHPGVQEVVMVDIDEEFVDLCRQHLEAWNRAAFDDSRLELRCEDINRYLSEHDRGFDVVIGDLVDFEDWDSPAAALYSRELYGRLRRRLNPGALVATQAGGLSTTSVEGHRRVRSTLESQFRSVVSYGLVVPSFYHLWSFAIASDGELPQPAEPPLTLFAQRGGERKLELPATGLASLAGAFVLPSAIRAQLDTGKAG